MSMFDSLKKQIFDKIAGQVLGGGSTGGGLSAEHGGLIDEAIKMIQAQGLGSLLQAFQSHGLGEIFSSWIGKGTNLPISPDQLHKVLGPQMLEALAKKFGLPVGQTSALLSQLLPNVVDHMTPNGQIEEGTITTEETTVVMTEQSSESTGGTSFLPGPDDLPK